MGRPTLPESISVSSPPPIAAKTKMRKNAHPTTCSVPRHTLSPGKNSVPKFQSRICSSLFSSPSRDELPRPGRRAGCAKYGVYSLALRLKCFCKMPLHSRVPRWVLFWCSNFRFSCNELLGWFPSGEARVHPPSTVIPPAANNHHSGGNFIENIRLHPEQSKQTENGCHFLLENVDSELLICIQNFNGDGNRPEKCSIVRRFIVTSSVMNGMSVLLTNV